VMKQKYKYQMFQLKNECDAGGILLLLFTILAEQLQPHF